MDNVKQDNLRKLDSLYKQREDLLIVGLTGRTGAGCSTVAQILQQKSFEKLDLKSYKTCDFNNSDERKYSIIHRFMKEGNKWKQFTIIEASSCIFSFLIEKTFKELHDFVRKICDINKIDDKDGIVNYIDEALKKAGYLKNDNADNKIIDEKIKKELSKLTGDVNKNTIEYFTTDMKEKKEIFGEELKKKNIVVTIGQNGNETDDNKECERDLYSFFMQILGNNLRKTGDCFGSKKNKTEDMESHELTVVRRIDLLISCIVNLEDQSRICIDALRCPAEILFFRDKYRAFYAMAVSTEVEERQNRLGMTLKQLINFDDVENPKGVDGFFHQNIAACMEIADIYLYNPTVNNGKYYELTEQIIKYIALMLHPGLIAPTHIERCMQLAFNAKYNSGCLSRQVGAIVTGADFSVRSVGWNDVPKGQIPCNLRCVEDFCQNKDMETFSEYELNDSDFNEAMNCINTKLYGGENKEEKKISRKSRGGRCYAYCFKDVYNALKGEKNQVYTRALHAEENAFLQIAKYGGAEIQGGKLFSTASPCELCSKKAYQLGITEIYYIDPYPGISKKHILSFGKIYNPKMILFKGAIGNAYISLYSPRLPYKDELEIITDFKVKNVVHKASNMR